VIDAKIKNGRLNKEISKIEPSNGVSAQSETKLKGIFNTFILNVINF
jgi:hypothetical protein